MWWSWKAICVCIVLCCIGTFMVGIRPDQPRMIIHNKQNELWLEIWSESNSFKGRYVPWQVIRRCYRSVQVQLERENCPCFQHLHLLRCWKPQANAQWSVLILRTAARLDRKHFICSMANDYTNSSLSSDLCIWCQLDNNHFVLPNEAVDIRKSSIHM